MLDPCATHHTCPAERTLARAHWQPSRVSLRARCNFQLAQRSSTTRIVSPRSLAEASVFAVSDTGLRWLHKRQLAARLPQEHEQGAALHFLNLRICLHAMLYAGCQESSRLENGSLLWQQKSDVVQVPIWQAQVS